MAQPTTTPRINAIEEDGGGPKIATSTTAGAVVPKDMPGTDTNDNASSGSVGEFVQEVVNTGNVGLTTGTTQGARTVLNPSQLLTLTPGDWDITVVGQMRAAGTGGVGVDIFAALRINSPTTEVLESRTSLGELRSAVGTTAEQLVIHLRVSIATTTSYEAVIAFSQISGAAINVTSATSIQSTTFPLVLSARRAR